MASDAQSGAMLPPLQPELSHRDVKLSNGLAMHYVQALPPKHFERPLGTIILVHGWPDCWYGWRRQIIPLANAGFKVVVPDQRGWGGTSAPKDDAAYGQRHICEDLLCLLDHLEVPTAVFIGHDWGGAVVWTLAQYAPERVSAVGAICTPFQAAPQDNPGPKFFQGVGTRFDYQVWFQRQAAVDELDADPARSYKILFRSPGMQQEGGDPELAAVPPTMREPTPGFINHFPADEDPEQDRTVLVDDAELQYYVEQVKRAGGFHGGLRWYRNVEANWKFTREFMEKQGLARQRISQQALMVTAGGDAILTPAMVDKYTVPYVPHLTRGNVEGAGHWVLMETKEVEGVPHHARATTLILNWLQSPAVTAAIAASTTAMAVETAGPSHDEEPVPKPKLAHDDEPAVPQSKL